MANCFYCDVIIGGIPYKCKFCGMIFCRIHRLPENHYCSFDLKPKKICNIDLRKSNIIYQDALEFMSEGLTVAKIYEYVTTKRLKETEALNLLNLIIENSDDIEDRSNGIVAFKLLNLKSKEAFNILEKCLISDINSHVRNTAAKVLAHIFPGKSKKLLAWAREHDKELNFEMK